MDAQFWMVIRMMIGYARVSTQDQNLDLQTEALTRAGCEKIYEDKISGVRVERPGLTRALEMLREGDTPVVWKLDRLGRSVNSLLIWLVNCTNRVFSSKVSQMLLVQEHRRGVSFFM
ncbi:Resolvase-like protein [Klebsiella pneumoniae]|nr:Resolvase-like protein [Klebsiella pneumoniae]